MQKIILFYKFVPLEGPQMVMRWQREMCQRLQLLGRIIISKQGINGTLGGSEQDLRLYIREMNKTMEFKGIDYKWSKGSRDDFPKLSVKVRDELVALAPDEQFDVFNAGTPLKAKAWQEFIDTHPEAVLFDARNEYESAIGAFKGAIKPKMKTFKEVKRHLDDLPKDKPVLAYCTGDVRCEYLSAYMKHRGFQEVYHLDGGILKYGEQYGDSGAWEGKCYVFDRRMKVAFSEDAKDIAHCSRCGSVTSDHINCANASCHRLILACTQCASETLTCSQPCTTAIRPEPV